MRKIEFNELNLKENYTEDEFLQVYFNTLPKEKSKKDCLPTKKYEIFLLNVLGGKIILLNQKHIKNLDTSYQELYYDYNTAYQIYNILLDIYDGIDAENNEINELYLEERLHKDNILTQLKQKDLELFEKALTEYSNSHSNTELTLKTKNEKLNFIKKILHKLFNIGGNK